MVNCSRISNIKLNKNMKKNQTFLKLLLLTSIVSIFLSCKKGQDDPAISFLSRKARLTGNWLLQSGNWSNITISTQNNKESQIFEFDGTYRKYTWRIDYANGQTVSNTSSKKYQEFLNFERDNSFRYAQVFTNDEGDRDSTIYEGYWYFLDKISNEDIKNKERVQLFVKKLIEIEVTTTGTTTTQTSTYEGTTNSYIMTIDLRRLSNKEIITEFDSKRIVNGMQYIDSGTKTYKQDK